jgi:hypothetical protein
MWRTHWGVTDDEILFNMNRQLLNAIEANDAGYIFTELLAPIEGSSPLGRAIWASTADFFGAMTKNRVGWGHSKAYYGGTFGGIQQGTEMYANFTATAAEFRQLNKVMRIFAPEWTDEVLASWRRSGAPEAPDGS